MTAALVQFGDGEPFEADVSGLDLKPVMPPDFPNLAGSLHASGSFEVTFDATDTDGLLWRCPGCGKRYEDLPIGHSWTVGAGCETAEPVSPAEFYEQTRRRR